MFLFDIFQQVAQFLQYAVGIIAILHLINELLQLKKQVGYFMSITIRQD